MSVKKLVSTLFALALIAGLMAACASPTPTAAPATAAPTAAPATAAPTTAPATAAPATAAPTTTPATFATVSAPVTLSYLVSQGWAPDAEIALAKKFAEQTGITIDYQVIPSDQYDNVLKTKLASGQGPDIFGGQSGKSALVVTYDVEKNAVDLSDQPWVKQEDPMVLDQASLNGKVYGLTNWQNADAGAWVIDYNKQDLRKNHLNRR